jgi:hypothetical protein
MARGKKYTAAEKHFQGIIDKLRKDKKEYLNQLISKNKTISDLEIEKERLETKCRDLEDALCEAAKALAMTPEDFQKHFARVKRLQPIMSTLLGKITDSVIVPPHPYTMPIPSAIPEVSMDSFNAVLSGFKDGTNYLTERDK